CRLSGRPVGRVTLSCCCTCGGLGSFLTPAAAACSSPLHQNRRVPRTPWNRARHRSIRTVAFLALPGVAGSSLTRDSRIVLVTAPFALSRSSHSLESRVRPSLATPESCSSPLHVTADEGLHALARQVVRALLGRGLHEVARRREQRPADPAVQADLGRTDRVDDDARGVRGVPDPDRKSTRLNSSHVKISYAV